MRGQMQCSFRDADVSLAERSLAAEVVAPLTRKRQKTSLSQSVPISRFGARKRNSSPSSEGNSRVGWRARHVDRPAVRASEPARTLTAKHCDIAGPVRLDASLYSPAVALDPSPMQLRSCELAGDSRCQLLRKFLSCSNEASCSSNILALGSSSWISTLL